MAEINKSDIITEEAIQAPLRLAENLEKILIPLDKIITNGKKIESSISGSKSIGELAKQTEALTKSQTDLDKIQKDISSRSIQRNKEEIKSLEDLVAKRNSLRQAIKREQDGLKELQVLMKQGNITREEYRKIVLKSSVAVSQYQQKIIQLNQDVKNEILLNRTVGNEYKQLTIQLERARLEYKNLAASGAASTEVLRRQQQVVNDLSRKVQTIDNAVGQFQRNVGNYPGTFAAATRGLTQFAAAFGLFTGVALFAKVIKEVIGLTVEYEYRNSQLKAILGATTSQVLQLRQQQQELGKSTVFTAVNVAQMQIELAKLGFPIDKIKEMTASTIDASIAMGSNLKDQATLTGVTLRSFGISAKETTRVNDVLAKSVSSSGLDFEKLSTAMPYVAANAKALNISLEGTAALMGVLANNGFQASTIGTTLRSIFLKLADSGSSLAKRLKEPVKDTPSLLRALKQLSNEGVDLATAFELTDKRAVSAFLTLISGAEQVKTLEEVLNRSAGAARQMANVMQDNLRGDTLLMTSAWQGLILALTEGDSVFSSILRGTVQLGTALLNLITPIKSVTAELKKEQSEVNTLVRTIVDENLSRQARKRLIEELNSKYPELLVNLDLEKVTNEQLTDRLERTNKSLEKKIELTEKQQKVSNLEARRENFIRVETNEAEKLVSLRKELSDIKQKEAAGEKGDVFTKLQIASLEDRIAASEGLILSTTKERLKVSREINKVLNDRADAIDIAGKSQKELNRLFASQANDSIPPELEELNRKFGGIKFAPVQSEEEKKAIEKFLKEYAKILEERKKLETQNGRELLEFRLQLDIKEAKSVEDRVASEVSLELFRQKVLLDGAKDEVLTVENAQGKIVKVTVDNSDKRTRIIADTEAKIKAIREKGSKDQLDQIIKAAQNLGKAQLAIIDKDIEAEISAVVAGAQKRGFVTEQDNQAILEIRKKYAVKIIDQQIKTLEKILEINNLEPAAQEKINEELLKLRKDLQDATFNQLKQESKKTFSTVDSGFSNLINNIILLDKSWGVSSSDTLAAISNIYGEFFKNIGQLADNFYASQINDINSQERALKASTDRQLKAAGDNDKAKEVIQLSASKREEELERKKIELQRKAAKFNKAIAITQATINTAQAYTVALTAGPYIGEILAALVLALGAVQIAAIASTPLPQYKDGTGSAIGGASLVSEEGSELVKTPSGRNFLTPVRPTIMDIPKGSQVVPHEETMRMLAYSALGEQVQMQNENRRLYEANQQLKATIKEGNKRIVKAIRTSAPNVVRQGSEIHQWVMDDNGNKKKIRGKSISLKL